MDVFLSLRNRRRHLSHWRRPFLVVTNCSGKWQKQTGKLLLRPYF